MLRGEKVILRATEREDIKRLWELEKNLDLVLWSQEDWMPKSLAAMEQEYDKALEKDDERANFVIEADGKVIGGCGLFHLERRSGTADFGIGIFDRDYVGKGYGRDAIRVLLDWAFRIQNWRRIGLSVLGDNERAIRTYKALGFVQEARLRQHGVSQGKIVDEIMMGLLRSEWELGRMKAEG